LKKIEAQLTEENFNKLVEGHKKSFEGFHKNWAE